jgi:hypothetical protein
MIWIEVRNMSGSGLDLHADGAAVHTVSKHMMSMAQIK